MLAWPQQPLEKKRWTPRLTSANSAMPSWSMWLVTCARPTLDVEVGVQTLPRCPLSLCLTGFIPLGLCYPSRHVLVGDVMLNTLGGGLCGRPDPFTLCQCCFEKYSTGRMRTTRPPPSPAEGEGSSRSLSYARLLLDVPDLLGSVETTFEGGGGY